jgi:SHS2 domain-containing protein
MQRWAVTQDLAMSRECHTFDHPADVGLAARADSLGELFEALAEGLADFICPRQTVRPAEAREVEARAEDREELAHDFLSAVLAEIQERRFVVASVAVTQATETAVAAKLTGEPYDPSRHEIRVEVKAVTYHQLMVAREGDAWTGTVILDL